MVRLFVDKLGTGDKDLFLRIEDELFIADSYYLPDFLEIENVNNITTSLECSHLIDFWITLLDKIELNKPLFLPFDFSDQYVRGILVTHLKKGVKLKIVYSEKIQGYSVVKSLFEGINNLKAFDFKEDSQNDCLVNKLSVLTDSLKMSKANLYI
ncbi:MAG: hypothetical protein WC121_07400 [Candidatus Kapaibacterium sp.]